MANITATTVADTLDDTDGLLSLREAIAQAAISDGADRIEFDASLAGQTVALALGEPDLWGDIAIDGGIDDPGADITLDAGGSSRIFNVTGGTSRLSELTLTGGAADQGGGLCVGATASATLVKTTGLGNHASGDGGGIFNAGDTDGDGNPDVAIDSQGTGRSIFYLGDAGLTLNGVTLTGTSFSIDAIGPSTLAVSNSVITNSETGIRISGHARAEITDPLITRNEFGVPG